ncbi:bifunctional diaminohydroxyphosphoribosylaminopyrimidine deaminase/5-amino-6-(5-phosphoribosylamino)uracil reductase RibD [soil metagenome]
MDHSQNMDRALELARRGAGYVSPNPMVGAVIVDDEGGILGEGWHGAYGGPHAEVWALRDAERRGNADRLDQATMYVTLEPCSHHGKTPPCADAIAAAGIPLVVAAMRDPNPRVDGGGFDRLRAAGVKVTDGVREDEARRLNAAFVHHQKTGRPLVTLKWAQTLDGFVATESGDSQWVSGEESRKLVHQWRAETDAVLVGSGTAAADDPALTVRHVEGRQPWRIVLDGRGKLPESLRLFSDEHAPRTIAVTREGLAPAYTERLVPNGGRVLNISQAGGHLDLVHLLEAFGSGSDGLPTLQSVLVEAGPGLATAFLESGLADRLSVFVAPRILGSGTKATRLPPVKRMADAHQLTSARFDPIGEDLLITAELSR